MERKIEVKFANEYSIEHDQKLNQLGFKFFKICDECKQFKKIDWISIEFVESVEPTMLAGLFRNLASMIEEKFKE